MSKPQRSSSNRVLPEEGTHLAICKVVADLGTQESSNKDWPDRHIILLLFELTELSEKNNPVYQTLRLTFTTKSKGLLKTMKSWMGVKDLADFDLKDALGEPALVTIEHNETGEYANITAVTAPRKGDRPPKGVMPKIAVFLDDTFDEDSFEELGENKLEWIQDKIMDSPEYEEVSGGGKKKGRRNRDEDEERGGRNRGRGRGRDEEEEEDNGGRRRNSGRGREREEPRGRARKEKPGRGAGRNKKGRGRR